MVGRFFQRDLLAEILLDVGHDPLQKLRLFRLLLLCTAFFQGPGDLGEDGNGVSVETMKISDYEDCVKLLVDYILGLTGEQISEISGVEIC